MPSSDFFSSFATPYDREMECSIYWLQCYFQYVIGHLIKKNCYETEAAKTIFSILRLFFSMYAFLFHFDIFLPLLSKVTHYFKSSFFSKIKILIFHMKNTFRVTFYRLGWVEFCHNLLLGQNLNFSIVC